MEEYIEYDIRNNNSENLIFFFSEKEDDKYEKIKELLKEDNGFLDIILEFDDFHKLYNIIKSVSKKYDINLVREMIIRQYLLYKIMEKAKIFEYPTIGSIYMVKDNIYGNDFENINKNNTLSYQGIDVLLERKAQETLERQARIHFMLDSVYDKYLQRCINDLYKHVNTHTKLMGYTTMDLRSYLGTNKVAISPYYEFKEIYTEEKEDEIRRRRVI